jgi:DNA-binding transcriptional ArsR family regulator
MTTTFSQLSDILTLLKKNKYLFAYICITIYYSSILKLFPMTVETLSNEQLTVSATETPDTLKINYHNLKKAALVLRALNHKLRQQILTLIETEKKITVTEIYVRLRLEQSVASQHLAILRRAGIVTTQRDGKFIYYTVNYKRIEEINGVIEDLVS